MSSSSELISSVRKYGKDNSTIKQDKKNLLQLILMAILVISTPTKKYKVNPSGQKPGDFAWHLMGNTPENRKNNLGSFRKGHSIFGDSNIQKRWDWQSHIKSKVKQEGLFFGKLAGILEDVKFPKSTSKGKHVKNIYDLTSNELIQHINQSHMLDTQIDSNTSHSELVEIKTKLQHEINKRERRNRNYQTRKNVRISQRRSHQPSYRSAVGHLTHSRRQPHR